MSKLAPETKSNLLELCNRLESREIIIPPGDAGRKCIEGYYDAIDNLASIADMFGVVSKTEMIQENILPALASDIQPTDLVVKIHLPNEDRALPAHVWDAVAISKKFQNAVSFIRDKIKAHDSQPEEMMKQPVQLPATNAGGTQNPETCPE